MTARHRRAITRRKLSRRQANMASKAMLRVVEMKMDALDAENRVANEALLAMVEKLEKQFSRAGKEQFKANTLAETLHNTLATGIDQLQKSESSRERELADLRSQLTVANRTGRLDVIKKILPALDGLSEAIAAGRRLMHGVTTSPAPRFVRRLGLALRILLGKTGVKASHHASGVSMAQSISAWLDGLGLVERRLIDVLAAEGVHPIKSENEIFDPHRHIAVETVPAEGELTHGVVARELRRGYIKDGDVLRYAEVAVTDRS